MIDSGIDLQSAEFDNRIDPASTSTAGNATIDDESGHGTAVAFTLAGRRNNTGTHGIAFNATLLVLRTDTPGTCTSTAANSTGCSHDDSNIAAALDVARINGARVVNISLGGSPASFALVRAIDRATAAGVIIVIAAGNDGTANPDPLAAIATNTAVSRGLVIIAGSVGTNDVISDFSDRAGTGANYFLTAVGERVRAPDQNNTPFLWTGTSFSAPQISGAAALLAQAFPSLTAAQIVSILYTSARDGGAAGIDEVYGRGILDLTRAFAPLGATALAGTAAQVSLSSNAMLAAPMGDARQSQLSTVVLDGYRRAFGVELGQTIHGAPVERPMSTMLLTGQRQFAASAGDMLIAVTIAPGRQAARVERLMLAPGDAEQARTLAASIISRLGSKTRFAIGFSQSAAAMTAQLVGRRDPAFLVARGPDQTQSLNSSVGTSMAVRQSFGPWGLTLAVESGSVSSPSFATPSLARIRYDHSGYDLAAIGVDHRLGATTTGLTISHLREYQTLLGAHFSEGLGGTRGASWFADANLRWASDAGWTIGAAYRRGWTFASTSAGLIGRGMVGSEAFAADFGKDRVFSAADSFGLRISQPLRVTAGSGIDLHLPSYYDYATGNVASYLDQRLNLAPTGREIDMEARYMLPLGRGSLQTNLFLRRDPGNIAALSDDYGLALRYAIGF